MEDESAAIHLPFISVFEAILKMTSYFLTVPKCRQSG